MQDFLVRITQDMGTAQLRLSRLLETTQMSPYNLQLTSDNVLYCTSFILKFYSTGCNKSVVPFLFCH